MNKIFVYLWLFIKRLLKRKLFIIILLSLPMLAFGFRYVVENGEKNISIGLVALDNGEYSKIVIDNLMKCEGMRFVVYDDPEQMKSDIEAGKLECGYCMEKDFTDRIAKLDMKGIVSVYFVPGSLIQPLSNEYVYAEIFSLYGYEQAIEFIGEQKNIVRQLDKNWKNDLKKEYFEYFQRDDTFGFEYVYAGDNTTEEVDLNVISEKDGHELSEEIIRANLLGTMNGLVTLFIMAGVCIGSINLYKDRSFGVLYKLKGIYGSSVELLECIAGGICTGISAFAALEICGGTGRGLLVDLIKVLVYLLACSVYFYLIQLFIRSEFTFCACIPMILLMSIVSCPVFFDFSKHLTVLKYVKYLFPPSWYL